MRTLKLHQIATLTLSLIFGVSAWAAPTSGTPYNNDPQREYVHDATSDAIGGVNMVLCIMNAMNMNGSGMLNAGPYVALVDINKCQSKGGGSDSSSSSSGASAAVNYMNAVVDVTRANDASPMIANVWMSLTEEGNTQDIYVKLTATQSPTEVPPYGVFRLDYQGKDPGGIERMRGFINSVSGNLKYLESGSNASNIKLALTATDTTSGSGTLESDEQTLVTYDFNYNPTHFRRSDNTLNGDRCFDRRRNQADRSVWRYGTYKESDGTRVDQAHPSFQVTGTYGGTSSYGYASYYGIGFQGLDLNSIADADPVPNLTVSDQRPGHSADYTLSKVKGKLTKWAKVDSTLAALNGIPFTFYGNLTGLTTGNGDVDATGWANWQMVWSNVGTFTVTGKQICGSSGCSLSSLNPVAVVNTNAFNTMPISGWSDSFGGNLNIPPTGSSHASGDAINYFSQSTVIPGEPGAPPTLYCLSNCPDAGSIAAANADDTGVALPFNTTTTHQWSYAPTAGGVTVSYTFNSGGLMISAAPMIINNANYFSNSTNYRYGVTSGRLFDTAFTSCQSGTAVCEPTTPAVYYTWSTSTDQWNQTMWLKSGGTIVTFDPPQSIVYPIPNDTAVYGAAWAGKTIQLQFNGFGNLGGIPGSCVDPVTNAAAPCSQNTRYVPAFSIPDGATMSLGGTTLVVKALDAEVRLKDIGPGDSATGCGDTLLPLSASLQLPADTDTHDVSAALGTYSVGPKPTVTSAPKVIDGVVQY
ncbi:MAG: hypothetical protein Q7U91_09780 [Sideroxyarcus sp.]|nr:hypothetical protein [Sideroxyarcus sp.]